MKDLLRIGSLGLLLTFFFACGGGGSSSSVSEESLTLNPVNTPGIAEAAIPSSDCDALLAGPPRGLACIHCTQSHARAQSDIIAGLMRAACVQNIATAYLVDDTFGYDEDLLRQHIRTLSGDGRTFYVTYYLANGPAQRRYDITRIRGFGSTIAPEEFRTRIQFDPELRESYQTLVRRLIPILHEAVAHGAIATVVPMLEDNLNDTAYIAMRDLTLAALPHDLPIRIGRSICAPGCFSGNEAGVPVGVVPEHHLAGPPIHIANGTISNDGADYTSPTAPGLPDAVVSLDQMRLLRDQANSANNAFILWSAERQGIPLDIGERDFPLPAERIYEIPSAAEQQELIDFLREGL